jgi:phosphoribosyl 1,2-cyclic phosphodiesterase
MSVFYILSSQFAVQPSRLKHDANEPFGFLTQIPNVGTVLFATDTYLQYTFDGLNNIMLECNYRQDILDANVEAGLLPAKLRARTMKSHCSFDTCKEILLANDLSHVHNIVLIHLSDGNANAKEFKDGIRKRHKKTVSMPRGNEIISKNHHS